MLDTPVYLHCVKCRAIRYPRLDQSERFAVGSSVTNSTGRRRIRLSNHRQSDCSVSLASASALPTYIPFRHCDARRERSLSRRSTRRISRSRRIRYNVCQRVSSRAYRQIVNFTVWIKSYPHYIKEIYVYEKIARHSKCVLKSRKPQSVGQLYCTNTMIERSIYRGLLDSARGPRAHRQSNSRGTDFPDIPASLCSPPVSRYDSLYLIILLLNISTRYFPRFWDSSYVTPKTVHY